jgi:hypothetical protein
MARPVRRFAFRLAASLGYTVSELLARLSAAELIEWMAYDRLEPLGLGRVNLGLASLAAMTANIHRDTEKRPEPFDPEDFLPYHIAPPLPELRQPSVSEHQAMEARMKAFFKTRPTHGD